MFSVYSCKSLFVFYLKRVKGWRVRVGLIFGTTTIAYGRPILLVGRGSYMFQKVKEDYSELVVK